MVAPSRVVLQYMASQGVIVSSPELAGPNDWPAVAGPIPPEGDSYVGVMNYGGPIQFKDPRGGGWLTKPRVQIMLRAIDEPTGQEKSQECLDALAKLGARSDDGWAMAAPVFVEDEVWALQSAMLLTAPMPIGYEKDRDLILYSMNLQLSLVKVTPANVDYLFPVGGYG